MHFKKDIHFPKSIAFDIKIFSFIGMAMMILAVTGLSLYFILNGNRSKFVNDSIEIVMLLTMITATRWAYYSFYKLDLNPHPTSMLDDLLLLICLPAFFIYCLLNCISGISGHDLEASVLSHTLKVCSDILRSTQNLKKILLMVCTLT